jgi:mannose-6-phosphate isomerase-like protein (cupin superfamily)
MQVGDELEEVASGTIIVIPAGQPHCIRNIGDEPLAYVSATVPPFDLPTADSGLGYR